MRTFGISLITLLTVFAVLTSGDQGLPGQRQLSEAGSIFALLCGSGAVVGVLAVREHVGGEGLSGLAVTIMAFYVATVLGALLAGTILFPILGSIIAVGLVWDMPWSLNWGAVSWWCGVLLLHFVTLHFLPDRAE